MLGFRGFLVHVWGFFAQKHCFEHKFQFLILRCWDSVFFVEPLPDRARVDDFTEPKISTNGPLQRPAGQSRCLSLFSIISCFFKCAIFVDYFLQILRVLHLRTPNSKAMVCIGTVYTALRRMHVATCSLNKKCFKKCEMTVPETTNKTQIDL